jgi:hypothetical protein
MCDKIKLILKTFNKNKFIPFYKHVTTLSILPHVFSRLEPSTTSVHRQTYKKIKKYGFVSVMTGVGIIEGT